MRPRIRKTVEKVFLAKGLERFPGFEDRGKCRGIGPVLVRKAADDRFLFIALCTDEGRDCFDLLIGYNTESVLPLGIGTLAPQDEPVSGALIFSVGFLWQQGGRPASWCLGPEVDILDPVHKWGRLAPESELVEQVDEVVEACLEKSLSYIRDFFELNSSPPD